MKALRNATVPEIISYSCYNIFIVETILDSMNNQIKKTHLNI